MAFWGALVRQGDPVNIVVDTSSPYRRLRISQAVLGTTQSSIPEFVQGKDGLYCKVGENPPICICCLRFKEIEMWRLDMEFKAPDNVVFSVIGRRPIYISGYYYDEPPVYAIMPQNRGRVVVESPLQDDPQNGGQLAPMQEVFASVEDIAASVGLNVDKNVSLQEATKSVADVQDGAKQSKNVAHENNSSSFDKCLEIVAQAGSPQINIRGSWQPLISANGQNEMQSFLELLMHIAYAFLTKEPCMTNWIAMLLRRMIAQGTLQVCHPMLEHAQHELKSERRRHAVGISLHELEQRGNDVEGNESIRLTDESAGELDRQDNLVEENGGSRTVEKGTVLDEAEQYGNLDMEHKCQRKEKGESIEPAEGLNDMDHLRGSAEMIADKQKIKPKRKKKVSKRLFAQEDNIDDVQLESVVPVKDMDWGESQLVDEERPKPEKKKKKDNRNSVSLCVTSINEAASKPNQQSDGVQQTDGAGPGKDIDCSREEKHSKKIKSTKRMSASCGIDEENHLSQTGECEIAAVNDPSVEMQQLKAKKKRKLAAMCDQDLCRKMSPEDDKDSTCPIPDERDDNKSRSSDERPGMPSTILSPCDASNSREIKKKKKKKKNKSKGEQGIVPVVDTNKGRCISAEPGGAQLTSARMENNIWTIVAALPAIENPKLKSTLVGCKENLELPSTVSCPSDAYNEGEFKKKNKKKMKTQEVEVPDVDNRNENSRTNSVESAETWSTSTSVDNIILDILSALPTDVLSELKHNIFCHEESSGPPFGEIRKKKKKKIEKVGGPRIDVNDESVRYSSAEPTRGHNNQKIPSSVPADGHPKLKHDLIGPEEMAEQPSDVRSSGETKKKKTKKGKKKTEKVQG